MMHDKFSRLRDIQLNQNTHSAPGQNLKFWKFEQDGDILGTIVEFNSFTHPHFGEQHTVVVRLADTNELVSAFLSGWLQEGIRRKQAAVGDLVLIQFFGKLPGDRFNRFNLEIEKAFPETF